MLDEVSKPAHYQGDGIECMEAMESMMNALWDKQELPPTVSYWWGCAFKYLWRWPLKNGRQDLEKAIQCILYLLNEIAIYPDEGKELVDKELVKFVERVREAVLEKADLTIFGEDYTHYENLLDAQMYGAAMKAAAATMRDLRDEALAECTDLYERKELIEINMDFDGGIWDFEFDDEDGWNDTRDVNCMNDFYSSNHHVKPRTLEDALEELEGLRGYGNSTYEDVVTRAAELADEIRELLKGE